MRKTNSPDSMGRHSVLGAMAAVSAGALGSVTSLGQTRAQGAKGEGNHSATNPGPGALRELHRHPNASEWQYWIKGSGRMTAFASEGQVHTMDKANDVGYVPLVAGHYIQNTGNDDVEFLALFKSDEFSEGATISFPVKE